MRRRLWLPPLSYSKFENATADFETSPPFFVLFRFIQFFHLNAAVAHELVGEISSSMHL